MIDHLLAIKTAVDTARTAGLAALPDADLDRFRKNYLQIVEAGYAQNPVAETSGEPPRRGRRKQSKARNLFNRFRDHPDGIRAFMLDFSVPFDNNPSERDLPMLKLRQKISGAFRSFDALVDFCRIRGYVSTARKSRTCSPASTPTEDHALYLDKLPACQNPAHPVNPVRKRPDQLPTKTVRINP